MILAAGVVTITQSVPWGEIVIAICSTAVLLVYMVLGATGRAPWPTALKTKMGDVRFGGTAGSDDAVAAVDALLVAKARLERRITGYQIRAARAAAVAMDDVFGAKADALAVLLIRDRFVLTMFQAAVENHVLSHITAGVVERSYLEDKVAPIREAWTRLAVKYRLGRWDDYEHRVENVVLDIIQEFAKIAGEETAAFTGQVELTRQGVAKDNPNVLARIDRAMVFLD